MTIPERLLQLVVGGVTVLTFLLGLLQDFIRASRSGDGLEQAFVIAGFIAVVSLATYGWFRVVKQAQPSHSESPQPVFRGHFGFTEKEAKMFHGRGPETARLLEKVTSSHLAVLCGNSGSGKSSLLRAGLIAHLRDSPGAPPMVPVYVNEWRWPKMSLLTAINATQDECWHQPPKPAREKPLDLSIFHAWFSRGCVPLLVLDQFEQVFLSSRRNHQTTPSHGKHNIQYDNEHAQCLEFVKACAESEQVKVLISIRKEWFYDLKTVFPHLPSPNDAVDCGKVTTEVAKRIVDDTLAQRGTKEVASWPNEFIEDVLDDLQEDGGVLLVELQIIFQMIEIKGITSFQEYNEAGGREGLSSEYLLRYINTCPDPLLAKHVLQCFSVREDGRVPLEVQELADILQREPKEVERIVHQLTGIEPGSSAKTDSEPSPKPVRNGVLQLAGSSGFELAHDRLAEMTNKLLRRTIDPVEIENIRFFWNYFRQAGKGRAIGLLHIEPKSQPLVLRPADGFLVLACVILLSVLFGLPYAIGLPWLSGIPLYGRSEVGLSPQLLLPCIAMAVCAWYVHCYYRWLLRPFFDTDSPQGRILSKTILAVYPLALLPLFMYPYSWPLLAGLGAWLVGLKWFQLSQEAHEKALGDTFRETFTQCMINAAALGAGFAMLIPLMQREPSTDRDAWLFFVQSFAALIVILGMGAAFRRIGKDGLPKIIGLWNRELLYREQMASVSPA